MYARVAESKNGLLDGTLPLFQCFGIALLLYFCFPLTCGPILGMETGAFALMLLLFIAYNRFSSAGRRALNMVLFWLAISFPFAVFLIATFQSPHQSQASHLYEIGEYKLAIDAYHAGDADGIASGANWVNYGDCYFRLGKYQKAIENYLKASEFQRERLNLERLPHHFGISSLKEELQSLAAVDFRLAKTYERIGNKSQAQKYFKRAKEQGYTAASWLKEMQLAAPNQARTHAPSHAPTHSAHASSTHSSTHHPHQPIFS
jgi:tetratricopeptide (TPR) repeat protein